MHVFLSLDFCMQRSMITKGHDRSQTITRHDVVPWTTASHVNAWPDGYTNSHSHTHPCAGYLRLHVRELKVHITTLHNRAHVQRM